MCSPQYFKIGFQQFQLLEVNYYKIQPIHKFDQQRSQLQIKKFDYFMCQIIQASNEIRKYIRKGVTSQTLNTQRLNYQKGYKLIYSKQFQAKYIKKFCPLCQKKFTKLKQDKLLFDLENVKDFQTSSQNKQEHIINSLDTSINFTLNQLSQMQAKCSKAIQQPPSTQEASVTEKHKSLKMSELKKNQMPNQTLNSVSSLYRNDLIKDQQVPVELLKKEKNQTLVKEQEESSHIKFNAIQERMEMNQQIQDRRDEKHPRQRRCHCQII